MKIDNGMLTKPSCQSHFRFPADLPVKYRRLHRTSKGQVLIEGVLGLTMVLAGGVLAAFLVLNSGIGVFAKDKLVIVTGQAAQFAVANSSDPELEAETNTFVQQLMPTVGLKPQDLNVTLKLTTVGLQTGVLVTVSNSFPIIGNGTLMPVRLQMSDTEFSANTNGCHCQ